MGKKIFAEHVINGDVLEAIGKMLREEELKKTLGQLLPKGYSWKQEPQVASINKIIEEAYRAITPEAHYKVDFEVGRGTVHGHLFRKSKKSKYPRSFAVDKRQAKQYASILEKAMKVPLMDSIGQNAKKKLMLAADIYRSYSGGWLTRKMKLTKQPIKDVDYALKKKMTLSLYTYLKGLISPQRYPKEYGKGHPKTEGFLIKMIKSILLKSYVLTENQIRQIIFKAI